MTELFRKVEKRIKDILKESPLDFDVKHAELTLKYVLELKPDADDALRIAALAHDIDRGVTKITEGTHLKDYGDIDAFKKEHAKRSAGIIKDILEEEKAGDDLIKKVIHLVENHEVGGDQEIDILTDADSISYFDYNIYEYHKRNGDEKTKSKIEFMAKRVSPHGLEVIRNIKYSDPEISKFVSETLREI